LVASFGAIVLEEKQLLEVINFTVNGIRADNKELAQINKGI